MKKILSILFAIALVASLCLCVSAADGLNDNEKAVLAKLRTTEKLGVNGASFSIPAAYVNAAENYFLTIDMTAEQKDAILALINSGIATVKAEAADFTGTGAYQLKDMNQAARSAVLQAGQEACALVGATLVYNAASNQVVITANGQTLFSSEPVVKTTGEAITVNASLAATVIALAVLGTTAVLFVTSKKFGLLEK